MMPAFSHQSPAVITIEQRCHQTGLKPVQLRTRIPQAGDLDDRRLPEVQPRTSGQAQEIDPASGDVLAHVPWPNRKAAGSELRQELGVNEVHLPEVWLAGVPSHPGEMLHGAATVRILLHTETGPHPNHGLRHLAEGVAVAEADGDNRGVG
jgi:hypothetical protein